MQKNRQRLMFGMEIERVKVRDVGYTVAGNVRE